MARGRGLECHPASARPDGLSGSSAWACSAGSCGLYMRRGRGHADGFRGHERACHPLRRRLSGGAGRA
eukprot:8499755-Pyramimonas_sp.AAC.1